MAKASKYLDGYIDKPMLRSKVLEVWKTYFNDEKPYSIPAKLKNKKGITDSI